MRRCLPMFVVLAICPSCGVTPPADPEPIATVSSALSSLPNPTRFLIVTSTTFSQLSALSSFVAYKSQTDGISTAVVTVANLVAAFPSAHDDAEAVKRGIEYYYRTAGVRYVMLAGDGSQVPVRYRTVAPDPQYAGWYTPSYTASDLYYSNLYMNHAADGTSTGVFSTWDYNNNHLYGEALWQVAATDEGPMQYNPDEVDGYPDIAVARVPAQTTSDLTNYLTKVTAYETNLSGTIHHLAFINDYYYSCQPTCNNGLQSANDALAIEGPAKWLETSGGASYVGIEYPTGSTPPSPFVAGNAQTIASLVPQSSWITYVGHGAPPGWGFSSTVFGFSNVDGLSNAGNYPIIYSVGCETGEFALQVPLSFYGSTIYYDTEGLKHQFFPQNSTPPSYFDEYEGGGVVQGQLTTPAPSTDVWDDGQPDQQRAWVSDWLDYSPTAGAIAYFGEQVTTGDTQARELGIRLMDRYAVGAKMLGDVWLTASQSYWRDYQISSGCCTPAFFDAPRIYLGVMSMLGDPSLRFAGAESPGQRDIAAFAGSDSYSSPYIVYRESPVTDSTASGDLVVVDENTEKSMDITKPSGAPKATGSIAAFGWKAGASQQIEYIAAGGVIEEAYSTSLDHWSAANLTQNTGAPAADPRSAITGYSWESQKRKQVAYMTSDGHVHQIYVTAGGGWSGDNDLTKMLPAPVPNGLVGGPMVGYSWEANGTQQIEYVTTDGHVHELYAGPSYSWADVDLTKKTGAPPAMGASLSGYAWVAGNSKQVDYVGANGHIYELYVSVGGNWAYADLMVKSSGNPPPANLESPIVGFAWDDASEKQIEYVAADGNIHELSVSTTQPWAAASPGLPAVAGQIAALAQSGQSQSTKEIAATGPDGHVRITYQAKSTSTWGSNDLTQVASAPIRW